MEAHGLEELHPIRPGETCPCAASTMSPRAPVGRRVMGTAPEPASSGSVGHIVKFGLIAKAFAERDGFGGARRLAAPALATERIARQAGVHIRDASCC